MDGQTDEGMDGWTDRQTDEGIGIFWMNRNSDGQNNRQRGGWMRMDGQTNDS